MQSAKSVTVVFGAIDSNGPRLDRAGLPYKWPAKLRNAIPPAAKTSACTACRARPLWNKTSAGPSRAKQLAVDNAMRPAGIPDRELKSRKMASSMPGFHPKMYSPDRQQGDGGHSRAATSNRPLEFGPAIASASSEAPPSSKASAVLTFMVGSPNHALSSAGLSTHQPTSTQRLTPITKVAATSGVSPTMRLARGSVTAPARLGTRAYGDPAAKARHPNARRSAVRTAP